MGKLDKLYNRSPVWLQNALVSTYGLYWHWARFGGNYQRFEEAYRKRESFSHQQWREYQQLELKQVLSICCEHVPYYRDHWTAEQKAAAKKGRLTELPLLEKDHLRANARSFWREDLEPFPKLIFHTSGTTGTPIATRFTLAEFRESLALREVRSVNWAGTSLRKHVLPFLAGWLSLILTVMSLFTDTMQLRSKFTFPLFTLNRAQPIVTWKPFKSTT